MLDDSEVVLEETSKLPDDATDEVGRLELTDRLEIDVKPERNERVSDLLELEDRVFGVERPEGNGRRDEKVEMEELFASWVDVPVTPEVIGPVDCVSAVVEDENSTVLYGGSEGGRGVSRVLEVELSLISVLVQIEAVVGRRVGKLYVHDAFVSEAVAMAPVS